MMIRVLQKKRVRPEAVPQGRDPVSRYGRWNKVFSQALGYRPAAVEEKKYTERGRSPPEVRLSREDRSSLLVGTSTPPQPGCVGFSALMQLTRGEDRLMSGRYLCDFTGLRRTR